jgi:hypothetical protein
VKFRIGGNLDSNDDRDLLNAFWHYEINAFVDRNPVLCTREIDRDRGVKIFGRIGSHHRDGLFENRTACKAIV